jgi:hypothetical protein
MTLTALMATGWTAFVFAIVLIVAVREGLTESESMNAAQYWTAVALGSATGWVGTAGLLYAAWRRRRDAALLVE